MSTQKSTPPGYRSPATPTSGAPRKGVKVTRPDDALDEPPRARKPKRRAPTYWERYPEFVRHPRVFGGVLVVIGAGLTWHMLGVLDNGGSYSIYSPVIGPLGLCFGFWPLLFGCPLDDEGHPPFWWTAGYVGSAIVGFVVGLALRAALAS